MLRLEGLKVGIENLMKSLKGDVTVSDVYDYEYDFKNQKEVRQIYPNNEGVEVYLGLSDTVEDGNIQYDDGDMFEKYIPHDRYTYKLDDTFKFDQHNHYHDFDYRDLHDLLQGVMLQYRGDSREVLNRWMRRHDSALYKSSPTVIDEYGDILHDALLVVELDPQNKSLENIMEYCNYVTISRVVIVDTPWTQTLTKKNGKTVTKTGVDRRLHVYVVPLDVEEAQERHDRELLDSVRENVTKRKLDEFLG